MKERDHPLSDRFCREGNADCVLGLQWGSEGKGAAVAWLAKTLLDLGRSYGIVTTNASSQAGHTAVHRGYTFVTRHLPTTPLIAPGPLVYLNAGCAIDPEVLEQELKDHDYLACCTGFAIHPNAAVISADAVRTENLPDSPQAQLGSTLKGVGEAIARKVQRTAKTARDHPFLQQYVRRLDLNHSLAGGETVLVEIPQGYGLSLNGPFYPYCTSRDCTVMQGLSDAHIHPYYLGWTMGVCRTFPIRVGGPSGGCYPDQREATWRELGRPPEITTVTKRERRVFSWSHDQLLEALTATRPDLLYLSHVDYVGTDQLWTILADLEHMFRQLDLDVVLVCSDGPTTDNPYFHDNGVKEHA